MPRFDEKKTLAIVFLTVLLDLIGFGIIIPIQPFFAETLGATPATVTLLGASFSLMQFLFAPFWGRLSDLVGRRPVMLVSILTTAVGYLLFGLAESLWLLFAARMLAGFGGANIGTAQAIIADSTSGEKRAKGMGLIGAAFGLGFILGPAMGGGFGQFGISAPAYAASVLSFVNFVVAWFYLPETYPPEARNGGGAKGPVRGHGGFSLARLKHAARHANVPAIFAVFAIFTTAFSLMEQVLGLFIERTWVAGMGYPDPIKEAAARTAYVLIVVGITATIVQGGLIGRLVARFGERRLLITGLSLEALAFAVLPLVGRYLPYVFMLPLAAFMAVGTGLANPSLASLLSRSVDTDEQGGALGLGQSLAALGRVFGPAMAGLLFQMDREFPFWLGAVMLAACAGVASTIGPTRSHAFEDRGDRHPVADAHDLKA